MKKRSQIFFGIARLPMDLSMVLGAFIMARSIRSTTDLIPGVQLAIGYIPPLADYLPFALAASILYVLICALNNLYSFRYRRSPAREFGSIVMISTTWIMLLIAYFFMRRDLFFSRLVMGYVWILSMGLVFAGRMILRGVHRLLVKRGRGVSRLLFIGNNTISKTLYQHLRRRWEYHAVGVVPTADEVVDKIFLPVLGNMVDLENIVQKHKIDEIVQTKSDALSTNEQVLEMCRVRQVGYSFVPDLVEMQRMNLELKELAGIPIIELKPTPLDGWGRVLKRLFDGLFSLWSVILLSPILIVVAVAIKIDSRGPVIYRSRRVAERGREFVIYKFRTMVSGADQLKASLKNKNERSGPLFKITNDPRITRVGKFLRKYSLDELPQLFNVLIGNMSLVGPRPHLPAEVEQYARHHRRLLTIKPGITGMAQVHGRSSNDFEREVALDLSYIENWSLWLDIRIIFRTIWVVFKGEDAV